MLRPFGVSAKTALVLLDSFLDRPPNPVLVVALAPLRLYLGSMDHSFLDALVTLCPSC